MKFKENKDVYANIMKVRVKTLSGVTKWKTLDVTLSGPILSKINIIPSTLDK